MQKQTTTQISMQWRCGGVWWCFCCILTSSGWAGTSWRLTWYLTLLRYFRANITRSKFIMYGSSAQRYTETCLQRIVLSPIIIGVEKFFKPLQKFEIILETAFYQFIHGNNLGEMFNSNHIKYHYLIDYDANTPWAIIRLCRCADVPMCTA